MDKKESSFIGRAADILGGAAGRVIVAALLILIAFELGSFCFSFGRSIFYQEPMETEPGTDIVITIPEGSDAKSVAELLEQEGIIRDGSAFAIQEELYEVNIYPGEYTLNTSMTTKEILSELNISEEEYQRRLAASEAAETSQNPDVIGGGDEADIISESEAESLAATESVEETWTTEG